MIISAVYDIVCYLSSSIPFNIAMGDGPSEQMPTQILAILHFLYVSSIQIVASRQRINSIILSRLLSSTQESTTSLTL